ncbi:MAG: adenylate kinase family protein [Methanomicrobium sp.]|nr:adenylate kinase family protein [Methanomicrobium sp.]
MMVCITGTHGTGKSSVSEILRTKGYNVVSQNDTAKDYIICADSGRDTDVIDEECWIDNFTPFDGIIEGHITHLLPCDKVIVLRCRPDILKERLLKRGYGKEKISENAMAEALDVILIEALENHSESSILEIDTTAVSPEKTACEISDFIQGKIPSRFGDIDWSLFLGDDI